MIAVAVVILLVVTIVALWKWPEIWASSPALRSAVQPFVANPFRIAAVVVFLVALLAAVTINLLARSGL